MLEKTGVFIVPRSSTSWRGNEAGWITASGWAAAGQKVWGDAKVATTDGVFSPQESMLFPRGPQNGLPHRPLKKSFRKFVPEFFITAYKDWNLKRSKPLIWPIERPACLANIKVMMVWQRHDLFSGPGRRLADRLGIPLVTSVEAPVVWEANKWGVKRPFWGKWLEQHYEARSLKMSDLVCCVSSEVRDKVIEMGVSSDKVIVSHNRVDSSVFHPGISGAEIRKQYGLEKKRILGWTGSFRSFHGLDTVVMAFKKVHNRHRDTAMILVGDGLEFESIKHLIKEQGLTDSIVLAGRQPFSRVPLFVANFDIALVSASSAEGFHYSPLKLREYLAAGKAVIAPKAGNLPDLFKDGSDLLFYCAGDAEDLAKKILSLLENSILQTSLQSQARELFKREGTWVHELKKVCDLLKIDY